MQIIVRKKTSVDEIFYNYWLGVTARQIYGVDSKYTDSTTAISSGINLVQRPPVLLRNYVPEINEMFFEGTTFTNKVFLMTRPTDKSIPLTQYISETYKKALVAIDSYDLPGFYALYSDVSTYGFHLWLNGQPYDFQYIKSTGSINIAPRFVRIEPNNRAYAMYYATAPLETTKSTSTGVEIDRGIRDFRLTSYIKTDAGYQTMTASSMAVSNSTILHIRSSAENPYEYSPTPQMFPQSYENQSYTPGYAAMCSTLLNVTSSDYFTSVNLQQPNDAQYLNTVCTWQPYQFYTHLYFL